MDVTMIDGVVSFLKGMTAQYPVLVGIFAILYMVGLIFKVINVAAESYVLETPNKADDEFLKKLEENKIFKTVKFIMDLLIRFKLK
jgi:hypothetical protein